MKWQPYKDSAGNRYDLSHLHPAHQQYRLPATITRPARTVVVRVTYGLHCFTRDPDDGESFSPEDVYHRNVEGRLFCPHRWRLSMDLPQIIQTILERRCWDAERRNHVMFSSAQTVDGEEYAIFFALRGAGQGVDWDATLLVISAHARAGFNKRGKPKKFRELLRARLP